MSSKDDMIEYNAQNVEAAFEVLIEELEDALKGMNNKTSNALERCDFEMAQRTIEYARRVKRVCEQITTLKEEWSELEGGLCDLADPEKNTPLKVPDLKRSSPSTGSVKTRSRVKQVAPQPVGRLIAGRIRKGLRTPESAFYCPILQALTDLGGSAKRSEIFMILEQTMRDVLKPIDYHILSSEAQQMRWQNSAQWARNLMVKDGLLRSNSPPGLWEITEKGSAFLRNTCSADGVVS